MLKENVIFKNYNNTRAINNTWKVIYNEAIRNNHILFDNVDEIQKTPLETVKTDSQNVEELASKLIIESSLTLMKREIKKLKIEEQAILFRLYKHFINDIKSQTQLSYN